LRISGALLYFLPLHYWLRFVKKASLHSIVTDLRHQRLQQPVEAALAAAVEVLAADDLLPECVAPEAAGRQFAGMLLAARFQADMEELGGFSNYGASLNFSLEHYST